MAKITNYIPEPKQEYDVENQKWIVTGKQRTLKKVVIMELANEY